jgi:hypothetical protein
VDGLGDREQSLREIGELFGGLDYAAVAQRIRRTKSTYNPIAYTATDHRNVECLDLTPIFPLGTEHRPRVQVCGAVSEFERRLQRVDKLRTSGFTRASVICLFEQPAECSDARECIHRRGFMLARVFGMREAADQ